MVDFKQAVCKVPDEVLANGAEYHKLTPSYLRSVGLPKAEFDASVAQILRDAVLLSYNPKFQSSFLQLPVFDVVKLKVIADMHLPHSDTITLSELMKIDARVPGIKQALRFAGIDTEELAKRYPVPAEASLQALALLWRKLCYTTFPVEQPETNYQPQAYAQQRACLS